jgi:uncharacterized membrane protein YoaK (UPF0700 family)
MRALWISSGPLVWALHFTALYGFAALACARGFAQVLPWVVAAATLVAGALAGALVLRHARRGDFIDWLTAALAAFALLAIAWQAVPAFVVPSCG